MMQLCTVQSVMIALFLAGCADQSSVNSVELLDERTGATMGALQEPIVFIETGRYGLWATSPEQASVSGWEPRFGSFILAPCSGLNLDDGPVTLSTIDLPKEARSPYSPMVPWGQTAYFAIDVAILKQMAASKKIVRNVRTADLTMVEFIPFQETNTALTRFMHERGITVD